MYLSSGMGKKHPRQFVNPSLCFVKGVVLAKNAMRFELQGKFTGDI